MTEARTCQRCGEPFPSRRGRNLYCRACGPVAIRAKEVAYRKTHREARRLYEAKRRQQLKPARLLRCWCGNLFVPRSGIHRHCTDECGQRARRAKLREGRGVVATSVPALPPVDHDAILTEILATMRRAQAILDAERELAGQAHIERQERLGRVLEGIR